MEKYLASSDKHKHGLYTSIFFSKLVTQITRYSLSKIFLCQWHLVLGPVCSSYTNNFRRNSRLYIVLFFLVLPKLYFTRHLPIRIVIHTSAKRSRAQKKQKYKVEGVKNKLGYSVDGLPSVLSPYITRYKRSHQPPHPQYPNLHQPPHP